MKPCRLLYPSPPGQKITKFIFFKYKFGCSKIRFKAAVNFSYSGIGLYYTIYPFLCIYCHISPLYLGIISLHLCVIIIIVIDPNRWWPTFSTSRYLLGSLILIAQITMCIRFSVEILSRSNWTKNISTNSVWHNFKFLPSSFIGNNVPGAFLHGCTVDNNKL